jgi:4-diphosphocytidyl-2-C-methyl-D-erythritol kinase
MNKAPWISRNAPAKLNLYLHLTGKREDGYHLLESMFAFLEVGDVLSAAPYDSLELEVTGPFLHAAGEKQQNLVWRAAELLSKEAGMSKGAMLRLEKHLPVGAGLGGGSADAAAALLLLNQLWETGFSVEELEKLALKLGADVPACLHQQPIMVRGIGEQISPFPALLPWHVVLLYPQKILASGAVYRACQPVFREVTAHWPEVSKPELLLPWLREQSNDLTPAAARLCEEIVPALELLQETEGCLLARMSGSGSCCFGLYASAQEAEQAAYSLRQHQPDWWVIATRFLLPSE